MFIYYVRDHVSCLPCARTTNYVPKQYPISELSVIPRCEFCDELATREG